MCQEVVRKHWYAQGGLLEAQSGGGVGRRGALWLEGRLGVGQGEELVSPGSGGVRWGRREDRRDVGRAEVQLG